MRLPSPSGEGVRGPDHGRMRAKSAPPHRIRAAPARSALISRLRATASTEGEAKSSREAAASREFFLPQIIRQDRHVIAYTLQKHD